MASNTIILRPVDCEVSSTGAYDVMPEGAGLTNVTAVNEVVADDATGYVTTTTVGSASVKNRYYTLGTPTDAPRAVVGGRLYVRYSMYTGQSIYALVGFDKDFSLDDDAVYLPQTSSTGAWAWTTHVRELPSELITAINNSLSNGTFPSNITIYLYISATGKGSGLGVTQIYLELDVETVTDIGIHHKVNGTWKAATAAYKKTNGVWAEITADECKAYLASSFVTK